MGSTLTQDSDSEETRNPAFSLFKHFFNSTMMHRKIKLIKLCEDTGQNIRY